MRRRWSRLIIAGAVGVAALGLSGCTLDACPAIGYLDTSPITLTFTGTLPAEATVSACFDAGCEPSVVTAGRDGNRRVPQRAPFVAGEVIQPRSVRVVVAAGAEVVHDAVHDIPVRTERTGLFGQCPGPWSYQPVVIGLE